MRIRLVVGDQTATATLHDTPIARDFASMLPLTLQFEQYADERIAYLSRKLTREGAPAGITPNTGDLAYYAPWGNLAIFMRDFRYSTGLLPLGRIDSGLSILQPTTPLFVDIERIDD